MKKYLILLLSLIVSFQSFGQGDFKIKKGYIGFSLGPSIYTGSPIKFINPSQNSANTDPEITKGTIGFNYNLIDAGYTFDQNWGVVLKLQGGSFKNISDSKVIRSNFGAILLGPMYSLRFHDDLFVDFKFKGGRFFNTLGTIDESSNATRVSEFNFGMEAGLTVRYNFSPQVSWLNNLDFQNQFTDNDDKISRMNITTGIGIRF